MSFMNISVNIMQEAKKLNAKGGYKMLLFAEYSENNDTPMKKTAIKLK
jgi:hypothetical protein